MGYRGTVLLEEGDIALMDGMFQKYMVHGTVAPRRWHLRAAYPLTLPTDVSPNVCTKKNASI